MEMLAKVLPSNFEIVNFEIRGDGNVFLQGEISNETVAIDLLESVRSSELIIDASFTGEIGRTVGIIGKMAKI